MDNFETSRYTFYRGIDPVRWLVAIESEIVSSRRRRRDVRLFESKSLALLETVREIAPLGSKRLATINKRSTTYSLYVRRPLSTFRTARLGIPRIPTNGDITQGKFNY